MDERLSPEQWSALNRRGNKYHARPIVKYARRWASKAELKRYEELSLCEDSGTITDLEVQPKFPFFVCGFKICTYIADFSYSEHGARIVEDVKSKATMTPLSRLKHKLFCVLYPDYELRIIYG